MKTIYDLNLKQLEEMLAGYGQKPYRAKQLFTWLYRKRAMSFSEMTDLPAALIEKLSAEYAIMPVKELTRQVSKDGTIKFLLQLMDGSSADALPLWRQPVCDFAGRLQHGMYILCIWITEKTKRSECR